jgi:hypothetical protein
MSTRRRLDALERRLVPQEGGCSACGNPWPIGYRWARPGHGESELSFVR